MNLFERIQAHLAAGGKVMVATYTKATLYSPKHAPLFTAPSNPREDGVYVARGRSRDYVLPQYVRFSVLK